MGAVAVRDEGVEGATPVVLLSCTKKRNKCAGADSRAAWAVGVPEGTGAVCLLCECMQVRMHSCKYIQQFLQKQKQKCMLPSAFTDEGGGSVLIEASSTEAWRGRRGSLEMDAMPSLAHTSEEERAQE